MREENWMQCQVCGQLHKVKMKDTSDEDVFIELYCPRCRDETSHILIGKYREDVYLYGNMNLDERYFIYNTK